MKKSQVAILAAAGLIAIIMLIVMGLGRLAVGKVVDYQSGESSTDWSSSDADTSKSLGFDGFDSVVVEGAWTVRINRSDDFATEIRYPSAMEGKVLVRVRGNQMVLGIQDWHGCSRGDLIAEISMPSLSEIRIEGAADASFTGFDENVLDIIIDGAANVEGYIADQARIFSIMRQLPWLPDICAKFHIDRVYPRPCLVRHRGRRPRARGCRSVC